MAWYQRWQSVIEGYNYICILKMAVIALYDQIMLLDITHQILASLFLSCYVQDLLAEIEVCRELYPSYSKAEVLVQEEPSPLTHNLDVLPKKLLLERHRSRFGGPRAIEF